MNVPRPSEHDRVRNAREPGADDASAPTSAPDHTGGGPHPAAGVARAEHIDADASRAAPARRHHIVAIAALVLLVALAAAWQWTPLAERIDAAGLAETLRSWAQGPLAPFVVIAVFVVAGLVLMPLMLLVTATVIGFGPWPGAAYALAGALASALATYLLGSRIGRERVRRYAGKRLMQVSARLARRGVLTVFIVRMVPVAPFTVVNLVAGASHLGLRDYMIGTLLGLLPGVLAIALVVDRVGAVLRAPSSGAVLTLVGIILAIALALFVLVRGVRRAAQRDAGSA